MIDYVLVPMDGSSSGSLRSLDRVGANVTTTLRPLQKSGADTTVWIVVGLFILPFPALLLINTYKYSLRISGTAISHLQERLRQRYMILDVASQRAASNSDLKMAITRDVPE